MKKENIPKEFYICDPKKNTDCHGQTGILCGVECFCTTNPKFSSDPNRVITLEEMYVLTNVKKKHRI